MGAATWHPCGIHVASTCGPDGTTTLTNMIPFLEGTYMASMWAMPCRLMDRAHEDMDRDNRLFGIINYSNKCALNPLFLLPCIEKILFRPILATLYFPASPRINVRYLTILIIKFHVVIRWYLGFFFSTFSFDNHD